MNAFPNVHDPKTGSMSHGMSLRDYFAAKALQAITPILYNDGDPDTILDDIARDAYLLADAMMKARDL